MSQLRRDQEHRVDGSLEKLEIVVQLLIALEEPGFAAPPTAEALALPADLGVGVKVDLGPDLPVRAEEMSLLLALDIPHGVLDPSIGRTSGLRLPRELSVLILETQHLLVAAIGGPVLDMDQELPDIAVGISVERV